MVDNYTCPPSYGGEPWEEHDETKSKHFAQSKVDTTQLRGESKGYAEHQETPKSEKLHEPISSLIPKITDIPHPVPMDKAGFHGLAGEIVRIMSPHSESDEVALLVTFLTCFGSVVGNRPYFRVESDLHQMRLFPVFVGETAKARKGTSFGNVKQVILAVDPDWGNNIQTGLSSGEGLIWAVRNEIHKRQPIRENGRVVDYEDVVSDPGVRDKRLLIVEGEFASTLKIMEREGNILSPIIRCAWDSGTLQVLTKHSQARATGAHISIIGHITQGELLNYLTDIQAGNGFGNRFLWLCVKRSKCLAFGGGLNQTDLEPLIERLKEAVEFAQGTDEIIWAKESRPLWEEIYPELSEGKPGLFGALTARSEAYVTRLACIFALLDLSWEIKPEHLTAALAVWDYAEASVKYIFQNHIGNSLADEIWSALEANSGGMSRTELSNHFRRNKSSDQLSSALNNLQRLGRIRMETVTTEGRPREVYICCKGAKQEDSTENTVLE